MEAIRGSVKGVVDDLTSLNVRQLLGQVVTLGGPPPGSNLAARWSLLPRTETDLHQD